MLMVVFVVKHFPMIGVEPSDLNNINKLSQYKLMAFAKLKQYIDRQWDSIAI